MYAVIFRATVAKLDEEYATQAAALRQTALTEYGCLEFVSVAEGEQEIAISYWPSEEAIKQWRSDPQHKIAQSNGKNRWYRDYKVEVVEITRQYQFP
ncbi:antibiotic biosynthesis monooxygenase [Vibrio sp. SCSIO 43136]|uniref:antibiotic biosynthesis monooxygenase family protein n=1 Tax=Vibrio sp. SCSIO 43136 TaxID=2819101 RepID=UPI0020761790|nr:antibiotic biosynthesis monooxygenase [Vibrio sp. SCSIO 43136]USD64027.1 antibiotic biosynthesis monooxygenase [Vibrio sp. SCSIO 43136]